MQKSAAYRAPVLVLVLLLVVLMNSTIEAADQHRKVCIRPKSNGDYNIAHNTAKLPAENPATVQDLVLRKVKTQLANGFTTGPAEYCSRKSSYSGAAGDYIDLYSYAYCGQGIGRKGCSECLARGAEVIKQSCGRGCYGAQASSDDCCIRFEAASFC
ncbi:hypothetical protein LINGRAHAP2_LOCUS12155 [Linum grandiflorum]